MGHTGSIGHFLQQFLVLAKQYRQFRFISTCHGRIFPPMEGSITTGREEGKLAPADCSGAVLSLQLLLVSPQTKLKILTNPGSSSACTAIGGDGQDERQ